MTDTGCEEAMVAIDIDAFKVAWEEYQKRDAEQHPHPADYPLVYALFAYLKAVKERAVA